jgi:hypothetical protein
MWAYWYGKYKLDDDYYVEASHWDGVDWSEPDTIVNAGLLAFERTPGGKIAVDADGNAWAVWRQALKEEDNLGDIYYSVNCGSGWSEPEPVDTHPGLDQSPNIAVDGEGRIWCVWGSTRDGDYGVWSSYTTGTGILEPVTPSSSPVTPTLTVDQTVGREFTFRVSNLDHPGVIHIYDASGRVVNSFEVDYGSASWNGINAQGEMLPSGVYFVKLQTISQVERVVIIR